VAELPAGVEMVMPGDNVELTIELITPVAMEKGLRFAIREGGRTVGAGAIWRLSSNRTENRDQRSENATEVAIALGSSRKRTDLWQLISGEGTEQCGKSSRWSARSARSGITQRRRTRRPSPAVLN
jgi:hypothetical protein